jgi:hypothetical protein
VVNKSKDYIKTKTVHFSLNEEVPSEHLIQALRESKKDRGKAYPYDLADKALGFIDNIIESGKK